MDDPRTIKIEVPPEPPALSVVLCLTNGMAYQRLDGPSSHWHPALSFQTNSMSWPMLVALGELIVLTTQDDLDRIQR